TVRGYELKVDVPKWDRWSGSLGYSHLNGIGRLPISGGLFLGDEVAALLDSTVTFPITQDQRHTVRGRVRYQAGPAWVAAAMHYNSGLPIEDDELPPAAFLVQQYGQAIVDRVDFDEGRIRPSASVDASFGWSVFGGPRSLRLQFDAFNLTN